jgi:hypothetical protein
MLVGLGATFQLPSPNPTNESPATKSDNGKQTHIQPRTVGDWITHDAAGFFTAWLVLVGFFQAGFFFVQLRYMLRAIDPAEKAAKAARDNAIFLRNAQRPYMAPVGVELRGWENVRTNPGARSHFLNVHTDIENFGAGAGFILQYGVGHDVAAGSTPANSETTRDYDPTRVFLEPKGKWLVKDVLHFHSFSLTPEEADEVFFGHKTLFLFGYIRYRDFFGVTRKSGFLYELAVDRQSAAESHFVIGEAAGPLWYDIEESDGGEDSE